MPAGLPEKEFPTFRTSSAVPRIHLLKPELFHPMNFTHQLAIAAVALLIGITTLAAAATFAKNRSQVSIVTASR